MSLDETWFTEQAPEAGSAFSLKLGRKLHEEQSAWQRIEIYQTTGFGNLMVIDGYIMLSEKDNFVYHEMMSHPVLFTHPAPRRVLIVGGGDCGTLREVLRHPEVEQVTQAEIDERVTRLAQQYFPDLCESNEDPRATLFFGDGIKWIKNAADESLDVIIVDSTDPIGPAEGLFGEPFYRECRRALAADGLLVQQSESPLLHMEILKQMYHAMRSAGYADVRTLGFPQPVYPSGWWSATMASKHGLIGNFRMRDARQRPFKTRYYSPAIHSAALEMPPFIQEGLSSAGAEGMVKD